MHIGRDAVGKEPYLAVFDVGATSVGVGIACKTEGTTTLLWCARIEYSYQAYEDYTRYERAMYSTLLDAGMKLLSDGIHAVRDIRSDFKVEHMRTVCVLESPWFFGAVGKADIEKEKAFDVSTELLQTLDDQACQSVLSESGLQSWRDVVGESLILEQERQQLLLNGYPVQTPGREHVLSAGVTVYVAHVSTTVHKQILQILERVLPHHTIELTTSTHILTAHYRSTVGIGTGHRMFLLEVEGQITSVTSVQQGVIAHISTLPLGTNHILKAAAPEAVSTEEARGVLAVACKKRAEENPEAPFPEPIQKACEEWREAVLAEFKQHSRGVVPPDHVLLMVGHRWYPILAPILSKPWLMPGIRKERSLVVSALSELIPEPNPPKEKPGPKPPFDTRLKLFTHATFYSLAPYRGTILATMRNP